MRIVRLERRGGFAWGAVIGDGIVDLSRMVGDRHGAIHAFLDDDGRRRLADHVAGRSADMALDDAVIAPFLPDPEKILCVGVNYHNRNAEYRDQSELPRYPSLFMRTPGSFTAHGRPLLRPRESPQLDYEGEIVIIIGKGGRRISRAQALGHIAGLTIMNEGTLRDWVRHAKFNVTQGKNFDCSGSIGPWMVTADAFSRYDDIALQTRVNGELRQDDSTANMIFPFDALIAYVSTFTTLRPGDIISTGPPTGAGARFDPPRDLGAGDMVEVSVPAIGMLGNPVADD